MAGSNSSFSQQGSVPGILSGTSISDIANGGNTVGGLFLNPNAKLNFGGPSAASPLNTSGLSGPTYQGGYTNAPVPQHPGLAPGATTGSMTSMTSPDGTKTTYAPASPTSATTPATPPPVPGTGGTGNTPGAYANQITSLGNEANAIGQKYSGLIGADNSIAGPAGLLQTISSGDVARENALLAGNQQALQGAEQNEGASLPGSIAPGNSLYNPLQGSSGYDPTSGAVKGAAYSALGPAYASLNTAQSTLQNISDNTDLFNKISNGVNATPSTTLNALANQVGTQFSSQDYAAFNAILPNIVSQYASYIGSTKGLSPTDSFSQASKEINQNSSIGTIRSVLGVLSQEANNTLSAQQKQYQDALGAYSSGSANTSSSGSAPGGFGWNG